MQKLVTLLAIIYNLNFVLTGHAQGWVAEIDLDLNHDLYAHEKIIHAAFTFSGVTETGTSETSNLQLVIYGTGAITGAMALMIEGLAFEPYYSEQPLTEPVTAMFSGSFNELCKRGFFEKDGETDLEQVYIWIEIFPRLEIGEFINRCDELSFRTHTCSDVFLWEVSDAVNGNYIPIEGKNSALITVARHELAALGFPDPYGRKYFRVTGRGGTTSQIQPVDIYYPPPGGLVSITQPRCHNHADGTVKVDITSPNPAVINDFVITLFPLTPAGQLKQIAVNDGFTATFGELRAGTYVIRIENNSSREIFGACKVDLEVGALQDPPAVSVGSFELSDFNGHPIRCHDGSDGKIRVNPIGGTGIYTEYEWSPQVSTTHLAENLPAGTYAVKVKDSNGCWSKAHAQELIPPQRLVVSLTSAGGKNGFDVSCADKSDGVLEPSISGGVPEYSFHWSDGSEQKILSQARAGFYELTVKDTNGCTGTASATLSAPEPIDFSIAEVSGIRCPGEHSGILEVQSLTNAIGQVYYSWSTGESGRQITSRPAGWYSVAVSDDQGCTATRHHLLAEAAAWTVEIIASSNYNGTAIRCHGDNSGELLAIVRDGEGNIAPAEQYTWYKNGNELASGTAHSSLGGVSAGLYKAEITDSNFCKVENTIVLQQPEPVVVAISANSDYHGFAISCYSHADGSIMALARGGTGAYHYRWENGETDPFLNGLAAGNYIVSVRDANGCEGTAEIDLKEPEPTHAAISVLSNYNGQPISCVGASDARLLASATGGAPPFAFMWNSGHTSEQLNDIPAGRYLLTATDANGCTAGTEKILIDPLPVKANIAGASERHGYGVSCYGASDGYLLASGSGGTGHYDFRWEGASHSGQLYENLRAGSYRIVVKDQNGCVATTQATVTEPPLLELETVAFKDVSCTDGADGEIRLAASGGAGDYTYSISGQQWQTDGLLTRLQAGAHEPVARDGNGCQQRTAVTLKEPLPISISFEHIEHALCGDARGKVSATVNGGTGAYQYEWRNAEKQVISTGPRLSDVPAGIFELSVLDVHHCEAIKTIGITSTNGPEVEVASRPASCYDAMDGKASLTAQGNGPFSFLWQDGQTKSEVSNLKKGTHLVEIKDADHCTVVESITISGPEAIEIEVLEKREPACHGQCDGKLSLSAKGGNGDYIFTWKDVSGPDAANLCAGQHEVTVTDQKGCEARKTWALAEPAPLQLQLVSARDPDCTNGCDGKIEISASGGTGDVKYTWANGSTEPLISELCAGRYSVAVTDGQDCSVTRSFELVNPAADELNLGGSITLCAGQTHLLDAGPAWKSYLWGSNTGFESTESKVLIGHGGMYWLKAVSSKGCIAQDTFLLQTSLDLLSANFLLASEAVVEDTVVIIDISWPMPERVLWRLPSEMERLADFGDIVYGRFGRAGQYNIGLEARLGQCRDEVLKSITILSGPGSAAGEGRFGGESFINAFALYPNPNDGVFDVAVEFIEESALRLTVWNTYTAKKIAHSSDSGAKSYLKHIDLRPVSAGPYTLRLDHERGTKYIRFIVK